MSNQHVDVNQLYAPLIREALSAWGAQPIYLALDTSMLWEQYCLIRVSVVYRGRAISVAWEVIEHGSSTVAFAVYRRVLERVPALLPRRAGKLVVPDSDQGPFHGLPEPSRQEFGHSAGAYPARPSPLFSPRSTDRPTLRAGAFGPWLCIRQRRTVVDC